MKKIILATGEKGENWEIYLKIVSKIVSNDKNEQKISIQIHKSPVSILITKYEITNQAPQQNIKYVFL